MRCSTRERQLPLDSNRHCRHRGALSEKPIATALPRTVIYQMLPRLFANFAETREPGASIGTNGCGKFNDINDAALASLKEMGFTHVWLTGILEQASGTAYPHRPADPPDILKGLAGSPYAITDYFDVCPDYAADPEQRIAEFQSLLARCHARGLKTIIDFVPNHVARSYRSDIKPELSFGEGDDRTVFHARDNHFYYLRSSDPGGGPPLKLPTAGMPGCDGLFAPETEFGRVTGNNVVSWAPSINDWYETVKLNYGHDFTSGRDTSRLPGPNASLEVVPRTWRTMDAILAYWQQMGVDGFRADMAHMIPMEFWRWSIKRARARNTGVFFSAEAYDNDPAKLTDGHVLDELLKAGFDAVYDAPAYRLLEGLYEHGKWANDLDALTFSGERFHHSLRYAENHDEVRLASPKEWGGLGMQVGKPVSAVLYGMSRGPLMLYSGQEVGEPALGAEGFSGDNARTTIFDYWSMPELVKWTNGGKFDGAKLSSEQKNLRAWYGTLLRLMQEPAFSEGEFYGLNHGNKENPAYGRLDGETTSGHWLYSYLRRDPASGQAFLVVANFHGSETFEGVRVILPADALRWLGKDAAKTLRFHNGLDIEWTHESEIAALHVDGVSLPSLPPLSAMMLQLT